MKSYLIVPIFSLFLLAAVGPIAAQVVDVNNDGIVGPHEAIALAEAWKQAAAAIAGVRPAWYLIGNTGTSPGTDFLGTTDDQALILKVGNNTAFRLEPDGIGPRVIGGSGGNQATAGAVGATISGGGGLGIDVQRVQGSYGTIGGGRGNLAGDSATIGGGQLNRATGQFSAIAGGVSNSATGANSTIGGGSGNSIPPNLFSTIGGGVSNLAQGNSSTIGGGESNQTGVIASRAVVAGGGNNSATGTASVIGGGDGNGADGAHATVGGGFSNVTQANAATISGGTDNRAMGMFSTIGGGASNRTQGLSSTVAGGGPNAATADLATVGGGSLNGAWALASTVSGGSLNFATVPNTTVGGGSGNRASGGSATVAGGIGNAATGENATVAGGFLNVAGNINATVPGGANNRAGGVGSFAAGTQAKAREAGTFVWADSLPFDFISRTTNEFSVRATGGIFLVTEVDPTGFITRGVQLAAGGTTWQPYVSIPSDRNLKENIEPVDRQELLRKLCSIEVSKWNYSYQEESTRHIGPMAQDFEAAFGLGSDGKQIDFTDSNGITLAAIQALNEKLEEKDETIRRLEDRLSALEERLERSEP